MSEQQPLWNVCEVAIAAIRAPDPETAERTLREALDRAGFEVFDQVGDCPLTAFEADDGTEPFGLPAYTRGVVAPAAYAGGDPRKDGPDMDIQRGGTRKTRTATRTPLPERDGRMVIVSEEPPPAEPPAEPPAGDCAPAVID